MVFARGNDIGLVVKDFRDKFLVTELRLLRSRYGDGLGVLFAIHDAGERTHLNYRIKVKAEYSSNLSFPQAGIEMDYVFVPLSFVCSPYLYLHIFHTVNHLATHTIPQASKPPSISSQHPHSSHSSHHTPSDYAHFIHPSTYLSSY